MEEKTGITEERLTEKFNESLKEIAASEERSDAKLTTTLAEFKRQIWEELENRLTKGAHSTVPVALAAKVCNVCGSPGHANGACG